MINYTNQAVADKQNVFFNQVEELATKLDLEFNQSYDVANDNLTHITVYGFNYDSELFFGIQLYPSTSSDKSNFVLILNSDKDDDQCDFGRVKQPASAKVEANVPESMKDLNKLAFQCNFRKDFAEDIDFDLLKLFIKEMKKIKLN